MALTNKYLESESPHLEGIRRVYRFASGYGLSLINSPRAHAYPFAWEAAIIGPGGGLVYNTSLTQDVEVFQSDQAANEFIERAALEIGGEK